MTKPKLTIIILNHDTSELLKNCLNSIYQYKNEVSFEVIVSDNASTDESVDLIKNQFKWVKLVQGPNISFSDGNNRARKYTKGKYVLFLNSDTIVHKNTLKKCVEYLDNHSNVGALTCKLVLPNGELDKDARRRFPTPWISFKKLFLGNGRNYWYDEVSPEIIQEVDAIQGAFFLSRKNILDKVGWWDEKFIYDGEDLDLSYQIKKAGYEIVYFPQVSIIHLKKATKNKVVTISLRAKMEGLNSMEYFFKKNLWNNYPIIFNYFVITGIKFLKLLRYLQLKIKR